MMKTTSSTLAVEFPARKTAAGSLAWILAWVVIVVAVAALGISVRQAAISGDYRVIITHQTITQLITVGFALIGALVASRRPRNPVAWIFVAVSVLYGLLAMAAAVVMVSPPVSLFYKLAYWLGSWLWIPATLLPATFVSLVFPDGRPPTPRWRFVGWSAGVGLALVSLGVMFYPEPLASLGQDQANPFGIREAKPLLDLFLVLGQVLLAVGVFGSLAALLVRFRRSAGIERQQLKWLVYALGMYIVSSVLTSLFAGLWPGFRWGLDFSITVTDRKSVV